MIDPTLLTVITVFLSATPPTVAAVGALIVGLRNSRKADVASNEADVAAKQTSEIHTMTNSNLSEVKTELKVAQEKIEGLQHLISSHLMTVPATVTPITLNKTKEEKP